MTPTHKFICLYNFKKEGGGKNNMTKRIILSLVMVALVIIATTSATVAYFSDTVTSTNNTFSTGTLDVDLYNQNTNDNLEFSLTDWAPGDETLINFDVLNSGSLPVNLRGYAVGEWNFSPSNPDKVKVIKVERYVGGWQQLANDSNGVNGLFYYSPDGTDLSLYTINNGKRAQMRLTVQFDPTAGDEYEGKVFDVSVVVEAKQVNAPWE